MHQRRASRPAGRERQACSGSARAPEVDSARFQRGTDAIPTHCPRDARATQHRARRNVTRPPRNTSLKLHQDSSGALNTVTGYGADYVEINAQRHAGSIIVLPEAPVIAWPVSSFEALAPEHFALLVGPAPEVVIFGSGERLRFPHPRLTAALAAQRIGVETMEIGRAHV